VGDVRLERCDDRRPLLGRLNPFQVLDDSEGVRNALTLGRFEDEGALRVDLVLRRQNEDDKVGDAAGVERGQQVSRNNQVLHLLLEAVDGGVSPAGLGDLAVQVETRVEAAHRGGSRDVRAERDDGDDARGAVSTGEDGSRLGVLVVLVEAHLLGAIAAVELGHGLLMGGPAGGSLEKIDFACISGQIHPAHVVLRLAIVAYPCSAP